MPTYSANHYKRVWLYVPATEIQDAMALGAVLVKGDSRLAMPHPLPKGIDEEAFDRWRSATSIKGWLSRFCISVMEEESGDSTTSGEDDNAKDRVYLHVPLSEMADARDTKGLAWDEAKGRYYVVDARYLPGVFRWLTENSQTRETIERLDRALEAREIANKASKLRTNKGKSPPTR